MTTQVQIAPGAVDGRTLGLWFGSLPTRTVTRKVVLHWTAGENPAPRVYTTLVNRGLSIHFVVDRDGRVVQMAPLTARAAHAGPWGNADSIGIEIVNPGTNLTVARPDRPMQRGRVHGRNIRYADFLPAQYVAVERLVRWLLQRFSLPLTVAPGTDRFPDVSAARAFQGVVGHYHVSDDRRKVDPGPAIMDHLRRAFGGPSSGEAAGAVASGLVALPGAFEDTGDVVGDTSTAGWWLFGALVVVGVSAGLWLGRRRA